METQVQPSQQLLKGINYGEYVFTRDALEARRNDKILFSIPLSKVGNSSVVNKQDVAIELQTDEIDNDDTLCEMRLYIPSKADNKEASNTGDKEDKGSDEEDKDETEANIKVAADTLNELILSKANLTQKAGDIIVSFNELPFIVPRGKYSCDLSINSLRMHGSTFNHILLYKNITKAFLLPKPDDVHMLFVLGLDKPVRQGNTSYHYLVMQMKKDTKETVKLRIGPEQLESQLNEKLKPEYEGNIHDVVAKVFKSIIKINIIIPGDFESSTKQSGVKCSIKASEGHLFFLTKSLIFVPKPVIYIKLDDLKSCEFHRLGSGSSSKLFDIVLLLKNNNQQYMFSGIDKKELDIIMTYFTTRNITVKTVNDNKDFAQDDVDDESDDDNSARGGRARKKPTKQLQQQLDDDDDESEDEDFIAEDDSGSDDEDADFDEEEEDEKPKKPKKTSDKKPPKN